MDIAAWLRGLGLQRYEGVFRDNDIDAALLPSLTEADLREIGVTSLGHRKRLLAAVGALAGPAGSPRVGARGAAPEFPMAAPQAERRRLTVLFCDLVGSTALAARLDPEELREVVAAYHRRATEVVGRWGGSVADYMGDGVLAFFGHPQAEEDDAERAVRAGLELVGAVGALAPPRGGAPLQARVGVATGLVVVGRIMGAAGAEERGAVGATPNLAARLQALAEPGAVVADAATRHLLGVLFDCRDLGPVDAKGFAGPVRAWRVLGPGSARSRSEALHAPVSSSPLIGRDEELGLLLRRWAQARDGEGRVVLLSGEPGIGKSRLAAGLTERLGEEPHTRMRYFCSPHHLDSPLFPIVVQFERAARFERDDAPGVRLRKLGALVSQTAIERDDIALIADLLGLAAGGGHPLPDVSPQRRKEMLLDALLRQLSGWAARRPVFVVFEDAQWADATSLELLGMAVERLRRQRALLVVTSRPGFIPPWAGSPHVTALALGGLARREAASLAAHAAGGAVLPDGAVERVVERAEGVPLFVEELTRAAVEADWHEGAAGASLALPDGAVPAALQAPLMARLDRLGPAKEVAQVGAAIGREFPYELLAAVTDRSEGELRGALERLVAAGLVSRTGEPPRAAYLFKHALLQDAAYGTLLLARRRELHARIARALQDRSGEGPGARPELLARHFEQAGMAEEAVGHYAEAGRQAIARSAAAEAATHLRKALDSLPSLPDTPARRRRELGLQTALGAALAATEGAAAPDAGRAHARARALGEQLGDAPAVNQIAWGQVYHHLERAEVGRALAAAEGLLRSAEREESFEARLAAHQSVGVCHALAGRLRQARWHLEAAAGLLDGAGERTACADSLGHALVSLPADRAHVLLHLGRYGQARALMAFSLAEAERRAHPQRLALAMVMSLWFRLFLREDAPRLLDGFDDLAADQDFRYWAGHAQMLRGLALARAGGVREGLALLRRGAARHDAAGAARHVPKYLAMAEEMVGGGEGLALVGEAFARSAGTDDRLLVPELHRIRGALLAGEGDTAGAEADFVRAIDIARGQDAKHWELRAAAGLAQLRRDQGRRVEARDLLAPVYNWFSEGFDLPDLRDAKALLDELA